MSRKYRKTAFRGISLALLILFSVLWCIPGGLNEKIACAEEKKPLVWNTAETVIIEDSPSGVLVAETKTTQSGKEAMPLEGSMSLRSLAEQQKRLESQQAEQLRLLQAFIEAQKKQQEFLFTLIGKEEKKSTTTKSEEKASSTPIIPAPLNKVTVAPAAPAAAAPAAVEVTPATPVKAVEPSLTAPTVSAPAAAAVAPVVITVVEPVAPAAAPAEVEVTTSTPGKVADPVIAVSAAPAPVATANVVEPASAAPTATIPAAKKKEKRKSVSDAVQHPPKIQTQPAESVSTTTAVNIPQEDPPRAVASAVTPDTVVVEQGQPQAVVTEAPAGVTPAPTVIVKTVYIERPAPYIQEQDVGRTAGDYIAENTQSIDDAYIKEAEVSFFYSSGGLYRFNTKEGFLTDIKLQPGEKILSVMGGDTVRWIVEQAVSGAGSEQQAHVYIKPLKSGLETNIIINTDRHSYQMVVQSTSQKAVPMVSWTYPQETKATFIRQQAEEKKRNDQSVTMATLVENLNFSYSIDKGNYGWAPERVFDDGRKVYIIMPQNVQEAPVLFVRDEKNRLAMVAYRVKGSYYIVDRLFREAEMRNGTDQIVRIKKRSN